MRASLTRSETLRASLPLSLAATILMIAFPLTVVWVSTHVLYFRLSMVTALLLSLALSFACSVAAALIWEHRSKNAEISFSELMIWSWYRLHRAERAIEHNVHVAETARSHGEQLRVLHELTAALESKDPYTRGHSKRVERHSFKTGVALGLPLAEVEVLRMSASLHDVGKIRVPNKVLHKPGALSAEERALIEKHPVLGSEMVANLRDEEVVAAVRHHHERWDGAGYPDRIAGTKIPLFSRVIAVSDSYDAIRSNRSYRRGVSRDEAVQVLNDEAGRQFDPEVVEAFLTTLPARGRAVAAITSLATGPAGLWRYIQQVLQRFGSTALAPTLGAAGTAVVIGTTSLLGPGIPGLPPVDQARQVSVFTQPSASSPPRVLAGTRKPGREAAQKRAARRAAQERAEKRAEKRAKERAAKKKEQRERKAATGTVAASSPATSNPDNTTAPEPAPAKDTTSDDPEAVSGDPKPEGNDCDEGKRQKSKGSRLHCN